MNPTFISVTNIDDDTIIILNIAAINMMIRNEENSNGYPCTEITMGSGCISVSETPEHILSHIRCTYSE